MSNAVILNVQVQRYWELWLTWDLGEDSDECDSEMRSGKVVWKGGGESGRQDGREKQR